MKMLFWNMRRWGQQDRRRQLVEFVNKELVDFVELQETFKEELSDR
jgi:hypothetical protein